MSTVADFIAVVRKELADPTRIVADDQLWTDGELIRYINECCYEFARRTHYFMESTSSICQVAVTLGDQWVDISERILRIRRAKLALEQRPLRVADSGQMDDFGGDWDADTGTPRMIMMGEENGRARFDRIPTQNDTLNLAVYCLPEAVDSVSDELPVPDHYIWKILPGVRSMAYGKQDADTFDANKALNLGGEFQANLRQIKIELLKLRRRSTSSRYRGPI